MNDNCWQNKECGIKARENCPAYPKFGQLCWVVAPSVHEVDTNGIPSRRRKDCAGCGWFADISEKHSESHDNAILVAKDCWEFFNCRRKEECQAYPDSGKYCWMANGATDKKAVGNLSCSGFMRGFNNCDDCAWHLHRTGQPFLATDEDVARQPLYPR